MTSKYLGPYEILSVLGRGGMGTVFKGRHESTGELVAIKALSHASADETHFRNRFESEIQALLKLNHPNIVRILSFGQEKGTLYFAMELVEGKSLFHLQREIKKFDWRDVLVIARDVALALRHAHDRGIIHRDLKPGNLMKSDKEGIIKVADFGIAKSFGSSNDTRDNVIGTLDFMSPEQASGKPVTVRSDLYSLGAVLYTLLTGQPPFAANSIEESLRNLTRVPAPPVRERVSNVPEELDMLIAELLEKKPENRTPTAFALLRKLDYVEQVLRNHAEAQTAHGDKSPKGTSAKPQKPAQPATPPPPAAEEEGNFELDAPEDRLSPTKHPTVKSSGGSRPAQATRLSNETLVDSVEPAAPNEMRLQEPEVRHDYFSPVTDQHRQAHFPSSEVPATTRGIGALPLFILLLAVVAAAGFGIYYATRPPSAESLYERIAEGASDPGSVREEMESFLKLYAQDDRATQVRQLLEVADAKSLFNLLRVRSNIPGESRLSMIQAKFVETVDGVNRDAAAGIDALRAFVTLNGAIKDHSLDDQRAVDAAKVILTDAETRVDAKIKSVRAEIQRGLDQAKADPAAAAGIYRSLIELYGDRTYASDLIDAARTALRAIE